MKKRSALRFDEIYCKLKNYYSEAMRYMGNAKECLQKAQKEGQFYNDISSRQRQAAATLVIFLMMMLRLLPCSRSSQLRG